MREFYVDGSCYPNPGGVGGWAVITEVEGEICCVSNSKAAEPSNSNNEFELYALLTALKWRRGFRGEEREPKPICIYTDSQYVSKIFNREHQARTHLDLWVEVRRLCVEGDRVVWKRAKSDEKMIEVDRRAKAAANQRREEMEVIKENIEAGSLVIPQPVLEMESNTKEVPPVFSPWQDI